MSKYLTVPTVLELFYYLLNLNVILHSAKLAYVLSMHIKDSVLSILRNPVSTNLVEIQFHNIYDPCLINPRQLKLIHALADSFPFRTNGQRNEALHYPSHE